MKRVKYKARSGKEQFRPVFRVNEQVPDNEGMCLACGETQMAEPDLRRGHCDSCSAPKVYGFEELALMGLLRFA